VDRLIADQMAYYELRAPDYGDASHADRKGGGMMPADLVEVTIAALQPAGDVLELACGRGAFTQALATQARTLTAVDASPTMLERNRAATTATNVTYLQADLFDWQPSTAYDFVFFGAWLSHVPESHFDTFWEVVRACLRPGGRVGFVDEDDRALAYEDLRIVDGTPIATRTLRDGRTYDIVKQFWRPHDLAARLRPLGWVVEVRPLDDVPYFVGEARVSSADG
jgi:demethylmenaquinone methyltransferase/2-methoxy-6-polyprenyl-1,4-benzoquinol methylase